MIYRETRSLYYSLLNIGLEKIYDSLSLLLACERAHHHQRESTFNLSIVARDGAYIHASNEIAIFISQRPSLLYERL